MKRGNEDACDGANEEQVSTEQDGSNDEQSSKNNAHAEDSSDSSSKSSVKRMRSEEQEVRLLIPSKVSDLKYCKQIIVFLRLTSKLIHLSSLFLLFCPLASLCLAIEPLS